MFLTSFTFWLGDPSNGGEEGVEMVNKMFGMPEYSGLSKHGGFSCPHHAKFSI